MPEPEITYMSDMEIMKGAAVMLAEKLLGASGSNKGSITVGAQRKGQDTVKYYRVVVTKISGAEVEHNQ